MPRARDDRSDRPPARAGRAQPLEAIEGLLAEELSIRENRRVKTALVMARLSTIKTIAGFDFTFQPSLDRNRACSPSPSLTSSTATRWSTCSGLLARARATLRSRLGSRRSGPGAASTVTLADLVAALAQAEREGRLRDKIRFFCRAALLIVDEIGYLPVVPDGGSLFFQLVNARYERGAMILTSNRASPRRDLRRPGGRHRAPRPAPAPCRRVIQIEGSSYRLRQHAELVPEHIRAKALIHPPLPAPRCRGRPPKPKDPASASA